MKLPEDVRQLILRRFQKNNRQWLAAGNQGAWPWEISLDVPTEQSALRQVEGVRTWTAAWQGWLGRGLLSWCERRWNVLAVQRLPEKLILRGPEEAVTWIGEEERWTRAVTRYGVLLAQWPALKEHLPRYFDLLADYSDSDLNRLRQMLAWLAANPISDLYPRQLPVGGIDSKWMESRRRVVAELLAAIRQDGRQDLNFYQRCGLKAPPTLIRMRVLDPALRSRIGGLGDITAPVEELASLKLSPTNAFIVENLQTGLAFSDLPGAVVFMRLGYHVDVLGRLPWVQGARCLYWGDLDTHGFAILNRARAHLGPMTSILMDEQTLLGNAELWGKEDEQNAAAELALLTEAEKDVYSGLKQQRWGQCIRLEQERIPWDVAWSAVNTLVRGTGPMP